MSLLNTGCTHIFVTVYHFSRLRSDVIELANMRRKRKTENQDMTSFQEEKNRWEFLRLEECWLRGGKIKAYRDMNCMEKMNGEWPPSCWREDETGRGETALTSTSTSCESPASGTSFTSVPSRVSCLWVVLAKNALLNKETAGKQRDHYRSREERFLVTTYLNEQNTRQRHCF